MAQQILKIVQSSMENGLVFSLEGELDAKSAPELRSLLDNAISSGKHKIILDCSSLKYVASAGIGTLNAVQKNLTSQGGEMVLSSVAKDIKDTMDLMYFTKKVKIFPSFEEAKKAIS